MSKEITYITLSGKFSIKYDLENPEIIKIFSAHQTQEYDKVEERDVKHIHYHPLMDISYEDLAGIWLAIHSSMLIKEKKWPKHSEVFNRLKRKIEDL